MLQGLDREIRQLAGDNPEAALSAPLSEAAEEAVRTIVAQATNSKELACQRVSWQDEPRIWTAGGQCNSPARARMAATASLPRPPA
jgi:hypothetical protein